MLEENTTETKVQSDIEKIEGHIDALKAESEELYTDTIAALESKRDELIAQAKAEVQETITEIEEVKQTFIQKYGQGVANCLEIILLAAILLKLLGAF